MLKQEPERKQSRIHSLNAGLIETPEEKEIREESERKSREEDNKELEINLLRSQTRAQIIQAITSAALLAFSLASGYIGYLQFLAAMTSANAAKDAADIARSAVAQAKIDGKAQNELSEKAFKATIDVSRNDQRAWVGLDSFILPECSDGGGPVFISEGCTGRIGAMIKNSGKTPALGFRIAAKVIRASPGVFVPEKLLEEPQDRSMSVLFPQQGSYVTQSLSGLTITKEKILAAKEGTSIFYFIGKINYQDIFSRQHFTTYCAFVSRDLKSITNCGFGNYTD